MRGGSAFLPPADTWLGFPGFLLAVLICAGLGAAICGRRTTPETHLVAGWGVLCLVLTCWGVFSTISLHVPLLVLAVVALLVLARRPNSPGGRSVWQFAALALPLWLVMLPLHASQIDTWLNLLPNAAYLADHGVFPTSSRPDSFSFLPGAPYNTQFVAFAGAVLTGGFSQAAMSWFNILLACAASLLLARVLATNGDTHAPGWNAPPWWALACGFLVAVPLNPGFTPRVDFASYGEGPLSVTLAMSVWLGAQILAERRAGLRAYDRLIALALVLAAMMNTKQSGLGLVLALAGPLVVLGLTIRGRRISTAAWLTAAFVPAIGLYVVWRGFMATSGVAELTLLPRDQWNTGIIPQILISMAHDAFLKGTFFALLIAVLVSSVVALTRRDLSLRGTVLMLVAGTAVLYNCYLFLTYVIHFPTGMAIQAHSYARYNFQLSLSVMLCLTLLLQPFLAGVVAGWSASLRRRAAFAAVALMLVLPLVLAPLLRFDFDTPQPALRAIAAGVAAHVKDGDRLGLVLPGDTDDNVASFLRGALLFTPPRRHPLDFRIAQTNDPATFVAMAEAGYPLVLATCTPDGLAGVAPHVAALLRDTEQGWQTVETWTYPPGFGRGSKSGMLTPLCR